MAGNNLLKIHADFTHILLWFDMAMVKFIRANPPKKIGSYKVLSARDYKKDEVVDMATGRVTPAGLTDAVMELVGQ